MFKFSKIDYGCFKNVKLVKNVIKAINGVPTIYLWKKNEEKGPFSVKLVNSFLNYLSSSQKMLVLVKCYDSKMAKATPHLFHPYVDSALVGS